MYGTPGVNATGCGPITRDPSWPADPIIMLDRGDCTFVQKVRHAENAGASAVLIVDNKPLCGPTSQGGSPQCPSCTNCMLSNTCECRLPYLVRACVQHRVPCTVGSRVAPRGCGCVDVTVIPTATPGWGLVWLRGLCAHLHGVTSRWRQIQGLPAG